METFKYKTYLLLPALLLLTQPVMATCGTTDYSGNSGRLYNMVVFILTCCTAVLYLLYAIAAILSIYKEHHHFSRQLPFPAWGHHRPSGFLRFSVRRDRQTLVIILLHIIYLLII